MQVKISASLYDGLIARAGLEPRHIRDLNPLQKAFVSDQSSRKVACCGRRGGKTTAVGCWLYEGMIARPGTRSVYITLSRPRARQILWDGVLSKLIKRYRWPLQLHTRAGQLMVEHPNGSSLWIVGCHDQSEADNFRGEPYYRVCIDEVQAFGPWLQSLITESLGPTLKDYKGQLALTGTPSAVPIGYFHDLSEGLEPGWSCHKWTILDNLGGFENPAQELQEELALNHWTLDSPTYRREWLGQWVEDGQARVYPFTYGNQWSPIEGGPFGLPPGEYRYGLGVDIGFGQSTTAFCLVASRVGNGKLYVLRAYTRSRLIPTALTAHCQQLRALVESEAGEHLRIVVDEGALGKGFAEQMRSMGVGCEAAVKSEKRSYQEYVQGLIESEAIVANFTSAQELIDESKRLQWDPDTGLEDERYPNHCCDALLYITRALFPRYNPEREGPTPGSPEAIRAEMQAAKLRFAKERQKLRGQRAY